MAGIGLGPAVESQKRVVHGDVLLLPFLEHSLLSPIQGSLFLPHFFDLFLILLVQPFLVLEFIVFLILGSLDINLELFEAGPNVLPQPILAHSVHAIRARQTTQPATSVQDIVCCVRHALVRRIVRIELVFSRELAAENLEHMLACLTTKHIHHSVEGLVSVTGSVHLHHVRQQLVTHLASQLILSGDLWVQPCRPSPSLRRKISPVQQVGLLRLHKITHLHIVTIIIVVLLFLLVAICMAGCLHRLTRSATTLLRRWC
mmetsp:Transcript_32296/g.77428  ORF Transcript_32296/g.77428 Transcript_32296/m.77428 type:complete len:259 (+) Transcript_32296:729-1505(+)